MINAYKSFWTNYANFSGKASRADYWWAFLANLIVSAILSAVAAFLGTIGTVLTSVFALACLIPGLAICFRRLHDVKKSGWWILINFIPLIGTIWFIVLLASKSK